MALAKREAARRGLYSRFFRGPVLTSDTEAGEKLVVGEPSPERNIPITEMRKGKKRKEREEGEKEGRMTQRKRKSKREDETKDEKKARRLERLMKKADEREVPDNRAKTGSMKTLAVSGGVVWDGDRVYYSDEKGRRKKRKGKDNESVRHES
jgi:hypothetical protein